MSGQGWDDDAEYRQVVRRGWVATGVAGCCSVVVVGLVVAWLLGVGVFVLLVEALSK
ncbi:putative membrane protein [Streptomyces davaonensis JCM 4913]|uniref:Putative membrane protein n=1 Tax=Streptomyces davaonensis (strain DSM 101723 / JCM 4913 / KCC S-0913 / 768) TaxID=1214101 RepID=K4QZG5_STRDJ|nr:hypothetical protein [Streptomyces davaonensis]CCK29426.1 putative membrane protein [Streptomyces davaonensis JCM 4913]